MEKSQEQDKRKPNRLILETSPYLLQHAYNPVDWFPWGDEAFQVAKQTDKPVFLSIGYSACHWCHVMEHESFEHPQIAQLMNDHFINIKVDREERPDLDQIYMSAVQLITRHGGWPMSVFLDHERAPFYGGTYWPPVSRHGMPGFADIIKRVGDYWLNKRQECLQSSREILEAISSMEHDAPQTQSLSLDTIINAGKKLLRSADQQHGGFGGAPKFPHSMDIRVLLRYTYLTDDHEAVKIIKLTLDKMHQGGLYDHLGGGFARYSTDAHWLVPHFEKMLYDNALLVPAYLEAWQLTADATYRTVVEETLDYILREMTSPQGAFYSTQDADSEGVEGKFYVWSHQEIIEVLGADAARIFCYAYDVTPLGNWEEVNILNRPRSLSEIASKLNLNLQDLEQQLTGSRQKLYQRRAQRIWPARDEKILTSWNAMMITAFAQAGRYLVNSRYLEAAELALNFIVDHMRTPDGRLWHGYKDGKARFNAYLDDYAALAEASLELFQANGNPYYLQIAESLLERIQQQFSDPEGGACFYTSRDHEELVLRSKQSQDNATPSGNTLAATAFFKAYHLTANYDYYQRGLQILNALSDGITQYPLAYGQGLIALTLSLPNVKTALLVPGKNKDESQELQTLLGNHFNPLMLIVWSLNPQSEQPGSSVLNGKTPIDDQLTCYVCAANVCSAPLTSPAEIIDQLKQKALN